MVGSLAFILLALLACMALALGVIAFFAIDAIRDGRRILNSSGERIVAQAKENVVSYSKTSAAALDRGKEKLGELRARTGSSTSDTSDPGSADQQPAEDQQPVQERLPAKAQDAAAKPCSPAKKQSGPPKKQSSAADDGPTEKLGEAIRAGREKARASAED